jgi:hypothetical protein
MPLNAQQIEWYSLPIGQGFLGTNMNPGHVQRDVHFDMDSSRHETHDGGIYLQMVVEELQ